MAGKVRNRAGRASRGKNGPAEGHGLLRGCFNFPATGWSRRDVVGAMVGAFATGAILINVLFMQSGSHPAPIFNNAPGPAKPTGVTSSLPALVPRPRPADQMSAPAPAAKTAAPSAARPAGEIINDIQRELGRRGYYDGVIDGIYGPKTDGAIRDFEQAAGLKPSIEPTEALLQAIVRSPAKGAKLATAPATRAPGVRNEAVADRPAASRRVIALQRALAEYGYGQIKPTGVIDAETQSAIEKFERERKLPITGQPSERVARELAAITGRPLE
jgi:peptidoglycan hydrolase-like protein with peptidoglycan-binding domain